MQLTTQQLEVIDLYNKETWIQIKKEYLAGIKKDSDLCWICSFSDTFQKLWASYYKEIIDFANGFLLSKETSEDWLVGTVLLFRHLELDIKDKQEIRVKFLDYMINKL